jgi:hypothetical protein
MDVNIVARVRRLVNRLRRQRTVNRRQRVAEDAERARLAMVAAVVDARRAGAQIPTEVGAAMVVLAGWTHWLNGWSQTPA